MTHPPEHSGAPGRASLLTAGVSAVLASACCLGPLFLLTLGVSGTWIGMLTALEPLRPLFLTVAAGALYLAYRRIFRPPHACPPGAVCAVPSVSRGYRVLFWGVAGLLGVALTYPLVARFFY